MTPALVASLKTLIQRIEADQASGLLDRATIKAKNELRLVLSRMGVKVDG